MSRVQKPGKRIDHWLLKPDRYNSDSHQYLDVEVEVRWEKGGMYYAEVDGTWYKSKDLDDLHKQVKAAVCQAAEVEWTRYIEVCYAAKHCARRNAFDDHPSWTDSAYINKDREQLGLDDGESLDDLNEDERAERDRVIIGLQLTWRVVEYSQPFKPVGAPADKLIRLKRDVDGISLESSQHIEPQRDDDLPDNIVPFTQERHELLGRIQAMFAKVDAQLVTLFRGDQAELARKLDAVSNAPLALGAVVSSEPDPNPQPALAAKSARRRSKRRS